jgi:hypothetical protein
MKNDKVDKFLENESEVEFEGPIPVDSEKYFFVSFNSRNETERIKKNYNCKYADRREIPECAILIRFNSELISKEIKISKKDIIYCKLKEIFTIDGVIPNKVEVFRGDRGAYKGTAIIEYRADSQGLNVCIIF